MPRAGVGYVDIVPNAGRFAADLQRQIEPALTRIGRSLSSAGSKLTRGLTIPLVAVGGAMVKLASAAEETENKVAVVFRGMADEILAWSSTAIDKMGLARQTAQDMASQFGLLFQAAKLPRAEVVGLSQDFVQLAADMSSFFDVPIADALDALRSGLVGETEPLRRFGVLLSEARLEAEAVKLGLIDLGGELTEQQKVQVRSAIIMGDLSKAHGDFARTSDSAANQARKMTEELKDVGAKLGKDLLPVFKDGVAAVSDLTDWFGRLSPEARKLAFQIAAVGIAAGPVLRLLGGIAQLGGGLVGMFRRLGPAAAGAATGLGGVAAAARASSRFLPGVGAAIAGLTVLLKANSLEAEEAIAVERELNKALRDGLITTDQYRQQLKGFSPVFRDFVELMAGAKDPTDGQRRAIFAMLNEVERLGGALQPLEKRWVANLLAAGGFQDALEVLMKAAERAGRQLGRTKDQIDSTGEAALIAEQKARGYAAVLEAIPENVRTRFQALGLQAIQNSTAALREQLDYLNNTVFTVDVIQNSVAAVRERPPSPPTSLPFVIEPMSQQIVTAPRSRAGPAAETVVNITINGDVHDWERFRNKVIRAIDEALARRRL